MKSIIHLRIYKPKVTLSTLFIINGLELIKQYYSVEPPYINNQQNVSCIREGRRLVRKHMAPSLKTPQSFFFYQEKERTEILMHVANRVQELRGCIAPGLTFSDIDGDGIIDVENSRTAMLEMYEYMPYEFTYIITSDPKISIL